MNKKGFTIVELLVTVALLAIISTISVISITSFINKNKENNYEILKKTILEASKEYGNVSTYVSTYDSIASINGDYIEKYLNRDEIISIQTPQIFNFTDIYNAHIKARKENKIYTDDASLLVNDKKKIKLIKGDRFNFKITTFDDLMILKSILEEE